MRDSKTLPTRALQATPGCAASEFVAELPDVPFDVKHLPATMRYIESYIHNTRLGVLLELQAGDEAARQKDEFRRLARDLVLQVAASKATSPAELLEQSFIKDPEQSVSHRIYVTSTVLRTPIRITRFVRYDADA